MIIIDTSVWIEFFKCNQPYFNQISDLFEYNDIIALSFIFGELLQGAKNNNEKKIIQEIWQNLPKINEDDIFIKAGLESSTKKWIDKGIGLIDSALIIASRENSSFIWTLDKKIVRLLKKEEIYSL